MKLGDPGWQPWRDPDWVTFSIVFEAWPHGELLAPLTYRHPLRTHHQKSWENRYAPRWAVELVEAVRAHVTNGEPFAPEDIDIEELKNVMLFLHDLPIPIAAVRARALASALVLGGGARAVNDLYRAWLREPLR